MHCYYSGTPPKYGHLIITTKVFQAAFCCNKTRCLIRCLSKIGGSKVLVLYIDLDQEREYFHTGPA